MGFDENTNWRAETIDCIEIAERKLHEAADSNLSTIRSNLAVAASNLALYDAMLALRDEVESLPARLERRLND